jgi:2-polyprenyl-3-methyl-5-hydroxy-6-metoxy-1,4-benzoquinol methylase
VNRFREDEDARKVFRERSPFPNRDAAGQWVVRIKTFLEISPPLNILNVGCGNGRHAIELCRRGHSVKAIDVTKLYLQEAKRLAEQAGVSVGFHLQRGSELTETAMYDTNTGEIAITLLRLLLRYETYRDHRVWVCGHKCRESPWK